MKFPKQFQELSRQQQEQVRASWERVHDQLIYLVEENYCELSSKLRKARASADKKLPEHANKTWRQDTHRFYKSEAIREFCIENRFFSDQRKGVQNSVLVKMAEKTINAKFASLNRKFKATGFNLSTIPKTGHEFEHWVASSLNLFDWNTRVTQGSGDQGVDIIAKLDGQTVAIQCKLYTGPVGNKSIQEVFAGAQYYETDAAAVIVSSRFTKSAQDLSKKTGVILCTAAEIPSFSTLFRNRKG